MPYNDYNYTTDHWYNYNDTTTSIEDICPLEQEDKNYCKYKHVCSDRSKCIFKVKEE